MGTIALAVALLLAPAVAHAGRVVLVGIDGASWNAVDPLLAEGQLPHLAALAARGVTAELETVEPLISPVVWTSIATGVRPERHGVGHFLATRFDLEIPTVFERLAAAGFRVGLYDYLLTWPPPELPGGFVIPGWLRRDASVSPPDAWQRAGVHAWVNDYDALVTRDDYRENARREAAAKPARLAALSTAFGTQVSAVTFYGVDAVSHRFWRDSYPEEFAEGAPAAADLAVQETLREVDRALGAIVASLGPEDAVLVASDHGFQADPDVGVVWETRLAEQLSLSGLEGARDGYTPMAEFGGVVLRVHPGPFAEREALLERARELLTSARTARGEPVFRIVQLVDGVERPPGAGRSLLERLRQRIARWFLWWQFDITLDQPAHGFALAMPAAEALERVWPDGEVVFGGRTLPVSALMRRHEFSGRHHPEALFAAAGGPIRHLSPRGRLEVVDVAPLIAYLAGAAIPDDLDGALPEQWIDPAHLGAHPPRRAPAPAVALPASGARPGAIEDAALIGRLRRLGYVE